MYLFSPMRKEYIEEFRRGTIELLDGGALTAAEGLNVVAYDATHHRVEYANGVYALLENIQRQNLNFFEEAESIHRLMTEFNMKQEELAERVAKNRSTISNAIRLLKLGEKIQQMIIEGKISAGHARTLIDIEDEGMQYAIALRIQDEQLSVREVEAIIRQIKNPKTPKQRKVVQNSFVYKDLEEKMISVIGTKVSVNQKGKGKGNGILSYRRKKALNPIL